MARYFFHLRRGDDLIEDFEGDDFEDIDAVRIEAVTAAKELLINAIRKGEMIDARDRVIISDERQAQVAEVLLIDLLPVQVARFLA